mmetsp:Transcript_25137/g.42830  ORF Transcript_25137/g.42830 Transcript_25137/m.42830 type:complete len:93 (-) Transcript_25137:328-606(-)
MTDEISLDLAKVALNLTRATHALQREFKDLAGKKEFIGVPDPVKLVRRIATLEKTMERLRKDCEQISERRSTLVPQLIDLQLHNTLQLKKVG